MRGGALFFIFFIEVLKRIWLQTLRVMLVQYCKLEYLTPTVELYKTKINAGAEVSRLQSNFLFAFGLGIKLLWYYVLHGLP